MDVDFVRLNYLTGSPGDRSTIFPRPSALKIYYQVSRAPVNLSDVTYRFHIPGRTEYIMVAVRSKHFNIPL
jgi:hypothetical protein